MEQLCRLLDSDPESWQKVAGLIGLDGDTVRQHGSPTRYILHCLKVGPGQVVTALPSLW